MSLTRTIILGTRGSRLALTQTEEVMELLKKKWGETLSFEIRTLRTTGDLLQKEDSLQVQTQSNFGKGLFTQELENALITGSIDIAVHSCKDMPTTIRPELCIGAVPLRASAQDILILKNNIQPDSLPPGSLLLTSSPRRKAQWLVAHPHTKVEPIRGNVDTRLEKLKQNPNATGLILAACGIDRLSIEENHFKFYPIPYDQMLPAPGQGALAVECRAEDPEILSILAAINHAPSHYQIRAERSFLSAMGGGCLAPIAAWAEPISSDEFRLHGIYFESEISFQRFSVEGPSHQPEALGQKLASFWEK